MRNSLLLYETHLEALLALPPDDLKKSLRAIRDYALYEIEPEPDGIAYAMLQMCKPIIDKNNRKAAIRQKNKQEQTGTNENKQEQTGTNENKTEQIEPIKGKGEKGKGKGEIKDSIGRFTPPSADEVREYARESGYHIDADGFIDFYASKGWMVGKNKMRDWRAAVRNWSRSDRQRQGGATKGNKFNFKGRDIDYDELERQLLQG